MKPCSKCKIEKAFEEFKKVSPPHGDRFGLSSQCRECERAANREYHRKNKEKIAQRKSAYNAEKYVRERDKIIARCSKYQIESPHVVRAAQGRRRAIKVRCLVSWTDETAIKEVYAKCPSEHHVDHIVPLQGKKVCGLHVPWNLQYLTGSENISKSNKWDPWEDSKQFDQEY